MISAPRFSIVLPCYNEADNIPVLLERFKKFAGRYDFELILVNNGSTDHSSTVLKSIQQDQSNSFLRVATIDKNIGYGHGIHTGLQHARGEILAYSHADIQAPPEDIFKAFDLIISGEVDINSALIKGFRINRSDNKTFLTQGLSQMVRFFLGVKLTDINGQPKVFHRAFFNSFSNPPFDFSYDIFVLYRAIHQGIRVHTFDVDFGERLHGQSKWATNILLKYKTILRYLRSILLISWRNRSERINPLGQFLRFFITGIFTNLLNYLTFWGLLRGLNISYIISSSIGFFAGFILGFFLNRSFTFHAIRGKIHLQMSRFLFVNLISLCINMLTIYLLVDLVNIMPEISQILAISVSTLINFAGSKFWAFQQEALS